MILAEMLDGHRLRAVEVEKCRFGQGRIALTRDLLRPGGVASRVSNATGYRLHEENCPGPRAFAAANFDGKKAGPNNYYRTFRRGKR